MRPHRTLTARGGLMATFGTIALVVGLVVGQREIVGVGLLLLLLPPIGALTLIGALGRVTHSRDLRPRRVAAGSDSRVLIRIGNSSLAWPVGRIRIEDTVPALLGHEPRYTLGHLGPRAVRDITYLVRPAVRGRYPVGPLRITVLDPLGCVRATRDLGAPSSLLVTPRFVPLGSPGTSDGSHGEDAPRRSVTGVGEQDPIPRAYRHGDELRRVHWRSTAKHGELMVRREEQHHREHDVLVLDTRDHAHLGEDEDDSLETAVSAAASIVLHLMERGHRLRLHTERGRLGTENPSEVLEELAVVEASEATSLAGAVVGPGGAHGPSIGLFVAVLGALSAEDVSSLITVDDSATRVAVLCSGADWPDPEAPSRVAGLLSEHGWRVLSIDHPTELPALWHRALSTEDGWVPTATASRTPWEGPR